MALRLLPLGDAQALIFFAPALTALIAWVVLQEVLMWIGICGVALSTIGMILIVKPPFLFGPEHSSSSISSNIGALTLTSAKVHDYVPPGSINTTITEEEKMEWSSQRALGTIFGLSSACLAAVTYTTLRIIGKKESSLTVALWFHLTAVAHSSFILLAGWSSPAVWPTLRDCGFLFTIAVCSFFANILLNRGFQVENAALVSGIKLSQLLYSHLIGILIFHEKEAWNGIVGAFCIAGGVFAVVIDKKQRASSKDSQPIAGSISAQRPDHVAEVQLMLNGSGNKIGNKGSNGLRNDDDIDDDREMGLASYGERVADNEREQLLGGSSSSGWRNVGGIGKENVKHY